MCTIINCLFIQSYTDHTRIVIPNKDERAKKTMPLAGKQ